MRIIHFASDGWYARCDDGFSKENVIRVADATASFWESVSAGSTAYVGFDTRAGASELALTAANVVATHGISAVLSASHCTAAALARKVESDEDACGGLMLTAGQRPAGNLGIRVLAADGGPADEVDLETIEALVPSTATDARAEVRRCDLMAEHLATISRAVDTDMIARSGLRVVCDPMYGSTRGHLVRLLESCGLDVTELHGEPVEDFDGLHPEVCEPWADDCERLVGERGADLGLLLEGCGDRLGVVDATGHLVSSHRLVALLLAHLVEDRGMDGRVVVPQSASVLVRRQAARLGCEVVTTPEGFRWLHDEAVHGGVLLAADERGGICIPAFGPGRDGMLAALLVIEAMAQTSLGIVELIGDLEEKIGHMEYGHRDVKPDAATVQMLRNMLPGVNPAKVAGMSPCEVNHMDGVRLGFADDSWLLVRPSRSESVVRVSAEAPSARRRDELLDAGATLARGDF
jgi:phosphomannomutase